MSGTRPISETRVQANGLTFAVTDWPGAEPAVFLAHATSFHARCWDQVVERLPEIHCIAIDMRGHGRSDRPPPPYPWLAFGEDVAAVAEALGLRGTLGVGHSKGGHAVINGAFLNPSAFAALLLIDPVVAPRARYSLPAPLTQHPSAKRRNHWASRGEFFERLAGREPFSLWDPLVLRDYCDFGLLPRPDGDGYELACRPEIESLLYSGGAGEADPYPAIESLELPVRIVRARVRADGEDAAPMSTSTCEPGLATHFKHAEDVYLPEYGHFIPMQSPETVATHIRELWHRL